jgi:hypothetical protein
MLLQDGKSEKYCAIQTSRLLTREFPARIPQKTKPGLTPPEVGAATSRNPERMNVANAINNRINNPIYTLKAKQAKERLILGCIFDEFIKLSKQEQQTRLPGFTELSAVVLTANAGRSAEEKKQLNRLAVKQMKIASSVTPQTALAKVEPHLQEALLLLKEVHGGHCCKFTHLGGYGAVGEITTNISGRIDDHQKGRLVNKEKHAFDWMDKEGMLYCLKAITPVINSGKCGVYHHPNGHCAIAIVYHSLPWVNPGAFFESGVVEKAAIIAVRGAAADGSQGLKVAANFQPGCGGQRLKGPGGFWWNARHIGYGDN